MDKEQIVYKKVNDLKNNSRNPRKKYRAIDTVEDRIAGAMLN